MLAPSQLQAHLSHTFSTPFHRSSTAHESEQVMVVVAFIKHVPGSEAFLETDGSSVHTSLTAYAIDDMDAYGVEAAIRLREAGQAHHVVAIGIGPSIIEPSLRAALALGADSAVLLETEEELDPISQAHLLADAVRSVEAQLLFVGGTEADWDSAALGPAVAEYLEWPVCNWVTSIALEGDRLVVRHDIDEGTELWQADLPAVLTTQQGLNEARFPSLPSILKAKRKSIDRRPVVAVATVSTVGASLPTRKRAGVTLEGSPKEAASELLRRLRDDAKVL